MLRLRTLLLTLLICWQGSIVWACPFCSAVSQTFSEEISTMDVVAITKLEKAGEVSKIDTSDPQAEIPKSRFVITKVIKGGEFIKVGNTFETIYFGEASKERSFLAMGTDAPNVIWSTPLILTDRAEEYLGQLSKLPKTWERLAFFQNYLEDEDEMLARDAYDEFAKAPYKDVISLKPEMKHDQLISFIKNPDVPSNRRRLYFTMLGVCGTKEDSKLLESFMTADDRKAKSGLDAMLACYMILSGEEGLAKVDELFLANKKAEYSDTYAAIMAIRFHGSETDVIPRKRLVKSLRYMLDRPELADLVIPDLARWEDWDVMPKLVELFVTADDNSSWVRVPVINYLRACPLPVAEQKIEELKLVDPDAVKRAMTFFPLQTESDAEKPEETTSDAEQETVETALPAAEKTSLQEFMQKRRDQNAGAVIPAQYVSQPTPPMTDETPQTMADRISVPVIEDVVAQTQVKNVLSPVQARAKQIESLTSIDTPDNLNDMESGPEELPNLWTVFGVTILGAGLCFATMRSILGIGS